MSILKAREDAGKVAFNHMMFDKLIEIASKDKELEVLRKYCTKETVAHELAEVHEAHRYSRKSNIESPGNVRENIQASEARR